MKFIDHSGGETIGYWDPFRFWDPFWAANQTLRDEFLVWKKAHVGAGTFWNMDLASYSCIHWTPQQVTSFKQKPQIHP